MFLTFYTVSQFLGNIDITRPQTFKMGNGIVRGCFQEKQKTKTISEKPKYKVGKLHFGIM